MFATDLDAAADEIEGLGIEEVAERASEALATLRFRDSVENGRTVGSFPHESGADQRYLREGKEAQGRRTRLGQAGRTTITRMESCHEVP